MKKIIIISLFLAVSFPFTVSANTLTESQIQAVLGLLRAFNVPQMVINDVDSALRTPVSTPSYTVPTVKTNPQKPMECYTSKAPGLFNYAEWKKRCTPLSDNA